MKLERNSNRNMNARELSRQNLDPRMFARSKLGEGELPLHGKTCPDRPMESNNCPRRSLSTTSVTEYVKLLLDTSAAFWRPREREADSRGRGNFEPHGTQLPETTIPHARSKLGSQLLQSLEPCSNVLVVWQLPVLAAAVEVDFEFLQLGPHLG